uniref:Putative product n=1 Tax=Xenopsylla cheopis TaxID=163159 RepID=A0A6M2DGM3_XENCH
MEKSSDKSTTLDNSHNSRLLNSFPMSKSNDEEINLDKKSHSSINLDDLDNALRTLIIIDEMQPFTIRSISPSAFSISPIEMESLSENEDIEEENECSNQEENDSLVDNSMEISVDYIDKCIAPLETIEEYQQTRKLDTILEGVYLETPPKKRNILLRKI